MIHVSKAQQSQVEYLIEQSIQGNHVLFDAESLRRALAVESSRDLSPLTEEEAYGIEHHIERMILQPTLAHKRAYLETLDSRTYAWVVKTYFNIVENNLYDIVCDSEEARH